MSLKNSIIAGVVLLLVGIGIGRYAVPQKVTEIKTEKKSTETEKEVIDREKKNADGSTEKEHIVRDVIKEKKETDKSTVVVNDKPNWKASALAGYDLNKVNIVYGLDVQRRILGTVSVGMWGMTNKSFGLSVGYEF